MNTAIILAGGLGTRLKSITKDRIPKPMVTVQGYPFLHWQMRYLKSQGIKKVIMAVSHHADVIQEYFKDQYFSIPITYSVENKPLGTGGAIAQAMHLSADKSLFILNGDTYFPINLGQILKEHNNSKNDISIGIKLMHNFDRYGTVDIAANKRIVAFNEKGYKEKGYINGGIYIINKTIFKNIPDNRPFSIEKEIFEQKLMSIKIGAYKSKAGFVDIGIPDEYDRIQTMNLK